MSGQARTYTSAMPAYQSSARYDLVICDIDGCLAPEASLPMDVAALAKVAEHNRQAERAGDRPLVTVCTGRPQPFAEAICRFLHNTRVPSVAENGVWLYHPGTNAYVLDPTITPEHLEIVHQAERLVHDRYAAQGVTLQPGKSASVTLYHPDPEHLKAICPEVRAEFERRGWPFRVSMTWLYINCDLAHVSKATGIQRLLEEVGIERGRVAGIGDTTSDVPLAQAVGLFACPANAQDEIKALAAYISPYAETAGVVDILRHLADAG